MRVQTFIPEFTIQAFRKGVLRGVFWLDKAQCYTGFLAPKKHRFAGKFGPIIAGNLVGFASFFHQLVQGSGDLPATDGHRD